MNRRTKSNGVDIAGILTIILIVLKLLNLIHNGWLFVFTPLLVSFVWWLFWSVIAWIAAWNLWRRK